MLYTYTKLIKGNTLSQKIHSIELKRAMKNGDTIAMVYHRKWYDYYQETIARYLLLRRVVGDVVVLT